MRTVKRPLAEVLLAVRNCSRWLILGLLVLAIAYPTRATFGTLVSDNLKEVQGHRRCQDATGPGRWLCSQPKIEYVVHPLFRRGRQRNDECQKPRVPENNDKRLDVSAPSIEIAETIALPPFAQSPSTRANNIGGNPTDKGSAQLVNREQQDRFPRKPFWKYVGFAMIILGVLLCVLFVALCIDKARKRKQRAKHAASLAKQPLLEESPQSPRSWWKFKAGGGKKTEIVLEKPSVNNPYVPQTLDGATDGWTMWICEQRDAMQIHRDAMEAQRASRPPPQKRQRSLNLPRIPSLNLPKPTLATVRRFSGIDLLDIDTSNRNVDGPRLGQRVSSKKWGSTKARMV